MWVIPLSRVGPHIADASKLNPKEFYQYIKKTLNCSSGPLANGCGYHTNYENEIAKKSKENPKLIWNYIKSKTKTREKIPSLYVNPNNSLSGETENDEDKANIFSDFFAKVFVRESDEGISELREHVVVNQMQQLEINEKMKQFTQVL